MKMKIARVFKPVVLGLCMSAWAFAGNAHAASSHVYSAAGCQERYPDQLVRLDRGEGLIYTMDALWVTCPIVTNTNSTQIAVTVMYKAALFTAPNVATKPDLFTCELQGDGDNSFDTKTVRLNIRNLQSIEGSLKLSMAASPRFNVLACYLLGSQSGFNFNMYGYQVDES